MFFLLLDGGQKKTYRKNASLSSACLSYPPPPPNSGGKEKKHKKKKLRTTYVRKVFFLFAKTPVESTPTYIKPIPTATTAVVHCTPHSTKSGSGYATIRGQQGGDPSDGPRPPLEGIIAGYLTQHGLVYVSNKSKTPRLRYVYMYIRYSSRCVRSVPFPPPCPAPINSRQEPIIADSTLIQRFEYFRKKKKKKKNAPRLRYNRSRYVSYVRSVLFSPVSCDHRKPPEIVRYRQKTPRARAFCCVFFLPLRSRRCSLAGGTCHPAEILPSFCKACPPRQTR